MILPTEALSHSGVYPDEFMQMRAFTCASPNTLVARTRFTFTSVFSKIQFCKYINNVYADRMYSLNTAPYATAAWPH